MGRGRVVSVPFGDTRGIAAGAKPSPIAACVEHPLPARSVCGVEIAFPMKPCSSCMASSRSPRQYEVLMHEPTRLSRRTATPSRDTPSRFYRRNCYLSRAASAPDLQPADIPASGSSCGRHWRRPSTWCPVGPLNPDVWYAALSRATRVYDGAQPRPGKTGHFIPKLSFTRQ